MRKKLEEEEYQRKVDELEAKHKAFLEENGLLPTAPKSPKSAMKAVLHDIALGLHQRGEKLEKLEDDTELLERNTADFYQKSKTLRIQKETSL